jgi:hypothetical protein
MRVIEIRYKKAKERKQRKIIPFKI